MSHPATFPATPELDKQAKARENGSQEIGEFLDWLTNTKGYVIGRYVATHATASGEVETLQPTYATIDTLLAEYFKIDLSKAEAERRALLAALRAVAED